MINRWNLQTHTIKTTCATPIYTIGNGQDYISEFHLVNDKIILTACQGDHQVMDKKRLSLLYPIRHRLLDDERESSHIQLYVAVSQVSQDGQRLLTLSNGGVLRIYDIENAQLIQQIKLPCPEGIVPIIEDCAISYDGTMIAYSYGNGIVYITTLNTIQYLIEKAKKSLNGRILNNEERRKYFLE
jgi:WD40 repeat protein